MNQPRQNRARDHAIHAERRQTAAPFEVTHQETHAQIRRDARQHAAEQGIAELIGCMETAWAIRERLPRR